MAFLENVTGLAKAAAIFAIIFGVSLGLCGANLVATMATANHGPAGFLIVTAWIELAGMVFSGIGLLAVGLAALVRVIVRSAGVAKTNNEADQ